MDAEEEALGQPSRRNVQAQISRDNIIPYTMIEMAGKLSPFDLGRY